MPKGSEELTNARKDEIINACAALYETMSFKEITLKEIGRRTSFTRTSIYNYFQTKEEIFLALMQREYEAWADDLEELGGSGRAVTPETFSAGLARTVERRERLLKLMSMNLYDVEDNSRLENLVAFKTAYNHALQAVSACLRACFPRMGETEIREFIYAFFPFLFGIYPLYLHHRKAAGGHGTGRSGTMPASRSFRSRRPLRPDCCAVWEREKKGLFCYQNQQKWIDISAFFVYADFISNISDDLRYSFGESAVLHRGWNTTEKGKRQGRFLHACREREAVENGGKE